MCRNLTAITLLVFFFNLSFGQVNFNRIHIIPELSVGYVIGVAPTWGVDLNVTSLDFTTEAGNPYSSRIGVSYNRFYYKQMRLRNWGFSVVNFSDHAMLKLGTTWMRTRWGEGGRNKSTSNHFGFNFEIGGRIQPNHPWLSYRLFEPANPCLWLPLRKQHQINLKYSYDFPISLVSEPN